MGKMIAVCGLDCSQCGAYLATKNNDDQKRAEVAAEWSREYRADVKLEEINCDGCQTETGVLFKHCRQCEIRRCARSKRLANCAYCKSYPCPLLERFPFGKRRLDEIREEAGLS